MKHSDRQQGAGAEERKWVRKTLNNKGCLSGQSLSPPLMRPTAIKPISTHRKENVHDFFKTSQNILLTQRIIGASSAGPARPNPATPTHRGRAPTTPPSNQQGIPLKKGVRFHIYSKEQGRRGRFSRGGGRNL